MNVIHFQLHGCIICRLFSCSVSWPIWCFTTARSRDMRSFMASFYYVNFCVVFVHFHVSTVSEWQIWRRLLFVFVCRNVCNFLGRESFIASTPNSSLASYVCINPAPLIHPPAPLHFSPGFLSHVLFLYNIWMCCIAVQALFLPEPVQQVSESVTYFAGNNLQVKTYFTR